MYQNQCVFAPPYLPLLLYVAFFDLALFYQVIKVICWFFVIFSHELGHAIFHTAFYRLAFQST